MNHTCPKCRSENISFQTYQENYGGKTITRKQSKYKEKRHGCLWWCCIGWWWWFVDLFLWIFLFFPRVLLHIGRRRDYKETSKSVSTTKNKIVYRTMGQCHDCGHTWKR